MQLHGDEGPSFCAEVARRTGAKVIKAVRIDAAADLQDLERFRNVDFHLLDTAARGLRGGTGETWDWALAGRRRSTVPVILSGGLTAENVAAGIAAVDPYAVDVASGVEAAPGVKDPDKLRAFMAAATRRGGAVVTTAVEHRFGPYGGQYVPETLMPALAELEAAWIEARDDAGYRDEVRRLADRLLRPPDAALPRRAALGGRRPARSGSSART